MGGNGQDGNGDGDKRPGVGVGVIVLRGDELLLVRRRTHGAGTWSTPGGYIDFGESPEECAVRETMEEVGVRVADPTFRAITNDVFADGEKHSVTIWMAVRYLEGDPAIVAAEELDAVGWFPLDALPQPLYLSTENFACGRTYPPGAGWRPDD